VGTSLIKQKNISFENKFIQKPVVINLYHEIFIALMTVFALAITVITLLTYRRTGNQKVLIISIAVGLFFIKGLYLSIGILNDDPDYFNLLTYSIFFDMLIVLLIFFSIVKRKR
jgi:hypothetical protein